MRWCCAFFVCSHFISQRGLTGINDSLVTNSESLRGQKHVRNEFAYQSHSLPFCIWSCWTVLYHLCFNLISHFNSPIFSFVVPSSPFIFTHQLFLPVSHAFTLCTYSLQAIKVTDPNSLPTEQLLDGYFYHRRFISSSDISWYLILD